MDHSHRLPALPFFQRDFTQPPIQQNRAEENQLKERVEVAKVPTIFSLIDQKLKELVQQGTLDDNFQLKNSSNFSFVSRDGLISTLDLLTKPIIIRGKPVIDQVEELNEELNDSDSVQPYIFEQEIALGKLLSLFVNKPIELVGSTVFWLLGSSDQPADFDLRIEVPLATEQELRNFCNEVKNFLAKECGQTLEVIHHKGLIKLHIEFSLEREGNRFSTITFGDQKGKNVELLFINHLKRKHLFTLDALRLPINLMIKILKEKEFNPKEVLEAINQGKYDTLFSFKSDGENWYQSVIDRKFGLIRADSPTTINEAGFFALLTHLLKGRRCYQAELDTLLFNICKQARGSKKLSEFLAERLVTCWMNHHQSDPLAAFILTFQTCLYLEKEEEAEIFPLWEKMQPLFKSCSLVLIKEIDALITNKTLFKEVLAFVQVKKFFALFVENYNKEEGLIQLSSQQLALRINLKGKFILLPYDLIAALNVLKTSKNKCISTIFFTFFTSIKLSEIKRGQLKKEWEEEAQKLRKRDETHLKLLGLYLTLLCGFLSENTRTFSLILDELPLILDHIHLIQNLKLLSLNQQENRLLENFQQIEGKESRASASQMRWCYALVESAKEEWVYKGYHLWQKLPSPSLLEYLKFVQLLAAVRPDLSLKLLQQRNIPDKKIEEALHHLLEVCKNGRKPYRSKDLPCLRQALIPFLKQTSLTDERFLSSLNWLALEMLTEKFYDGFFELIECKNFWSKQADFWLDCWDKLKSDPVAKLIFQQYLQKYSTLSQGSSFYQSLLVELLQSEIIHPSSNSSFTNLFNHYIEQTFPIHSRLKWLTPSLINEIKKLPTLLVQERLDILVKGILNQKPALEEKETLTEVYCQLELGGVNEWQTILATGSTGQLMHLKPAVWNFLQTSCFQSEQNSNLDKLFTLFLQLIKSVEITLHLPSILDIKRSLTEKRPTSQVLNEGLIEIFLKDKGEIQLTQACELMSDLLNSTLTVEKKQKIFRSLVLAMVEKSGDFAKIFFVAFLPLLTKIEENKDKYKFLELVLIKFKQHKNQSILKKLVQFLEKFLKSQNYAALPKVFIDCLDSFLATSFQRLDQKIGKIQENVIKKLALNNEVTLFKETLIIFLEQFQKELSNKNIKELRDTWHFIHYHLLTPQLELTIKNKIQIFVQKLLTEWMKREKRQQSNLLYQFFFQFDESLGKQEAQVWKTQLAIEVIKETALKNRNEIIRDFYSLIEELIYSKHTGLDFIHLLNLVVFIPFAKLEFFKQHYTYLKKITPLIFKNFEQSPYQEKLNEISYYVNVDLKIPLNQNKLISFEEMIVKLLTDSVEGMDQAFFMLQVAHFPLVKDFSMQLKKLYEKALDKILKLSMPQSEKFIYLEKQKDVLLEKLKSKDSVWLEISDFLCYKFVQALLQTTHDSQSLKKICEVLGVLYLFNHFKENYCDILKNIIHHASFYINDKLFAISDSDKIGWLLTRDPLKVKQKKELTLIWITKLCKSKHLEYLTSVRHSITFAKNSAIIDSQLHREIETILLDKLASLPLETLDSFITKSRKGIKEFFHFCDWEDHFHRDFSKKLEDFLNSFLSFYSRKNDIFVIHTVLEDSFVLAKKDPTKSCAHFWLKWACYLMDHPQLNPNQLIFLSIKGQELIKENVNFSELDFIFRLIKKTIEPEFIYSNYQLEGLIQKLNEWKNSRNSKIDCIQLDNMRQILMLRLDELIKTKQIHVFYKECSLLNVDWINKQQEIYFKLNVIELDINLSNCFAIAQDIAEMIDDWPQVLAIQKIPHSLLKEQLKKVTYNFLNFLDEQEQQELSIYLEESYLEKFFEDYSIFKERRENIIIKEENREFYKTLNQCHTFIIDNELDSWMQALNLISTVNFELITSLQQKQLLSFLQLAFEKTSLIGLIVSISQKFRLEIGVLKCDPTDFMQRAIVSKNPWLLQEASLFGMMKLDHYSKRFKPLFFEQFIELVYTIIENYFESSQESIIKLLFYAFNSLGRSKELAELWLFFLHKFETMLINKAHLNLADLKGKVEVEKGLQQLTVNACNRDYKYRLLKLHLIALPWMYAGEENQFFNHKNHADYLKHLLEEIFEWDLKSYQVIVNYYWDQWHLQLFTKEYGQEVLSKINKGYYEKMLLEIHAILDLNKDLNRQIECSKISFASPKTEKILRGYKTSFYKKLLYKLCEVGINEQNELKRARIIESKILILKNAYELIIQSVEEDGIENCSTLSDLKELIDVFIFQSIPVYCTHLENHHVKCCLEIIIKSTKQKILTQDECQLYFNFLLPLTNLEKENVKNLNETEKWLKNKFEHHYISKDGQSFKNALKKMTCFQSVSACMSLTYLIEKTLIKGQGLNSVTLQEGIYQVMIYYAFLSEKDDFIVSHLQRLANSVLLSHLGDTYKVNFIKETFKSLLQTKTTEKSYTWGAAFISHLYLSYRNRIAIDLVYELVESLIDKVQWCDQKSSSIFHTISSIFKFIKPTAETKKKQVLLFERCIKKAVEVRNIKVIHDFKHRIQNKELNPAFKNCPESFDKICKLLEIDKKLT